LETIKRSIIAILTMVSGCIFVVSVIAAVLIQPDLFARVWFDLQEFDAAARGADVMST
jgi:hypothetical protein